jgi:hypothetical protein
VDRAEILEAWAPPDDQWSLWVRPILFAQMEDDVAAMSGPDRWRTIDVTWAPKTSDHVMVLIDLPGAESVWMGMALAQLGYRPVPLFNACTGSYELVDQRPLMLWKVFPQDLPSVPFLKEHGCERALLVQRDGLRSQPDLAAVLRHWQNAGIVILAKDVADSRPPVEIQVERPPWYRWPWERLFLASGLRRNPLGGFGSTFTEPHHG